MFPPNCKPYEIGFIEENGPSTDRTYMQPISASLTELNRRHFDGTYLYVSTDILRRIMDYADGSSIGYNRYTLTSEDGPVCTFLGMQVTHRRDFPPELFIITANLDDYWRPNGSVYYDYATNTASYQ